MNPVELALLARLLVPARKPPSAAEVIKSLRPLFGNASDVEERLRAGLERLATSGLRTPDAMTLTTKGREQASRALGVKSGAKPTWTRLRSSLVEAALGRAGTPLGAGAVRAVALAKKLGLETKSTKPAEVLDAWAARELGMDGVRLTVANVRAFALSRAIGIESLRDPKRIGAVATAHKLGVPRMDARLVQDAVLRDWLAPAVEEEAPPSDPLQAFATSVKELARAAEDGRFGRHKVFIGPIWKRASVDASFESMKEDEFKALLVDAHRAGLLRLSRADLTPAMSPAVVAASEVPYLNAVFHFVDLEGTLS